MAEDTAAVAEPPRLFESFLNLEFGRQLGLMLGLAASVAIGVGLALWLVVEKDYKPLYANLERIDAANVLSLLEGEKIDYRIDQRSGALLVDASKIHQARIVLSSAGMPMDKNVGFELLDKEQPLGTSQFMENARYRRGLEGELARTISNISSVRAARVHLAVPKSTVFLRDAKQARASVFLETYAGFPMEKAQVRAIANLVASSVPELTLENVTVVDQRGNLLSEFNTEPEYAEAARQLDYSRRVEKEIQERINGLLEPVLGAENFRAEVAALLDFTRSEQASEVYNPDFPAVRSEQTSSEELLDGEVTGGVPGALSNQPVDGTAQLEQAGQQIEESDKARRAKNYQTRNFELDRTISFTQQQVGRIKRLTVAVAVADKAAANGSDNWTPEELERLSTLIQNAVGYDVTRGDSVSVVNTPFVRDVPEPIEEIAIPIWEQPIFWTGLRIAGGTLAFILLVFMVLKPTLNRLTENSKKIRELELKHKQALNAVNQVQAGASATIAPDGSVQLTGASENLLPAPGDMLDERIDLVKKMISEDPDRVAQVIQGWAKADE